MNSSSPKKKFESITLEEFEKDLKKQLLIKDPKQLLLVLCKIGGLRLTDCDVIAKMIKTMILIVVTCLNHIIGDENENKYVKNAFTIIWSWLPPNLLDIFYCEVSRFIMMQLCIQKEKPTDPKKDKLRILLHPEVVTIFFPGNNFKSYDLKLFKMNKILFCAFVQISENKQLVTFGDHIFENFYRELDYHFFFHYLAYHS